MKERPIIIVSIGYIIGILLGVYFEKSISLFIIILLSIITIINYKNKAIILFSVFLVVANIITNILVRDYEKIYNMDKEEYIGIIESNKIDKKYKDSYYIKINNHKFILNIKKSKKINLSCGDKIIFKGTYEKPKERSNYKGFDYSKYLKSKKIYGEIELEGIIKKTGKKYNFKYLIINLKKNICKNIDKLEGTQGGILKAILIGETNDIDNGLKEDFSKSSLSHMLAISGTHIGYIIMFINTIMKKDRRKSYFFTIIILIIFMNMIGFTPSVMRASIMNITYVISKLLKRKNDGINSICLSLLLILISNPFNIFDIGLLLSFGGTIGIILFYDRIKNYLEKKIKIKNKFISYIITSISISFSAQIIIFPIMLIIFGSISFTFFVFNILAGPILGFIIFFGIIFVILPIKINSIIIKLFIDILILITKLSNIIPLSKIYVPIPAILTIILIYINIGLIYIRKYKAKYLLITIAIISTIELSSTITNGMKINFIDVGQGDCTLIRTIQGKNILIDAGGCRDNTEYDIGKNTVLPYLLHRKINKIDYMMISHFDADHCNGCEYILKNYKVKNVIIAKQAKITKEYTQIINIAKKRKVKVIYVKNNDKMKIDGRTYLEIYHPDDKLIDNDINENSIIAKLIYKTKRKEFSMLFVGDIEKKAEETIIGKNYNIKSDILKVGHHGSKTSSTEKFLRQVNPKIALIGVGKDNNFGHPNDKVLDRLTELRSRDL